MVLVTRIRQIAPVNIDTQTGSEKSLLNIVRGQGVAGKQQVKIPSTD